MNALLFANLHNQRALIRSHTAYPNARLLINGVCIWQLLMAILVEWALFSPHITRSNFLDLGDVLLNPADNGISTAAILISILVAGWMAAVFLIWSLLQAYFDMADAALASVPDVKSNETELASNV